jgi:Flp pilus assembly protein TadD
MKLLTAATLAALLCGCAHVQNMAVPGKAARDAERRASELMEAPRPNVNDLLTQGDRLRDSGDVSQAAWTYLKAMRLDPTRNAPVERIGFLHLANGDSERAEAMFDSVLKSAPNSGAAMTGRGLAQLRSGDLEAARSSLQRAIELDPKEPSQHNNLGLALAELGRFDEALAEFRAAGDEAAAQNNL